LDVFAQLHSLVDIHIRGAAIQREAVAPFAVFCDWQRPTKIKISVLR
jgi:hypothetical protein